MPWGAGTRHDTRYVATVLALSYVARDNCLLRTAALCARGVCFRVITVSKVLLIFRRNARGRGSENSSLAREGSYPIGRLEALDAQYPSAKRHSGCQD